MLLLWCNSTRVVHYSATQCPTMENNEKKQKQKQAEKSLTSKTDLGENTDKHFLAMKIFNSWPTAASAHRWEKKKPPTSSLKAHKWLSLCGKMSTLCGISIKESIISNNTWLQGEKKKLICAPWTFSLLYSKNQSRDVVKYYRGYSVKYRSVSVSTANGRGIYDAKVDCRFLSVLTSINWYI